MRLTSPVNYPSGPWRLTRTDSASRALNPGTQPGSIPTLCRDMILVRSWGLERQLPHPTEHRHAFSAILHLPLPSTALRLTMEAQANIRFIKGR